MSPLGCHRSPCQLAKPLRPNAACRAVWGSPVLGSLPYLPLQSPPEHHVHRHFLHNGIQGSSAGGSEDGSAYDVDDGAEGDPEYHEPDLHAACAQGDVKRVQVLLDQGADVNKYWHDNFAGGTALHFAIREGNSVELVQLLLERGADLGVGDKWGWTPLHRAVGQDDTLKGKERGRYTLPFVELLIKAGADIHAQDKKGKTPLHLASEHGRVAVVRLLMQRGAVVDARDKKGKTPLHWASTYGRVEAVRLLLKRGAVVGARDEEGRTPLHAAAEWMSRHSADKVVKLLAAAGANINARDKKRNTALHIAAMRSKCTAVRQLVKQPGVQLDALNAGGLTPVAVAVKEGNLEAVKVLHAAGADMLNPKLHRVPLPVRAEKALDRVINEDEETVRYEERDYYFWAQNRYRVAKYLKAACGTAAAPSTPAKPRRGRPPRSAGGPAAGGSDSEE